MAPERVITNAHVLAGMSSAVVRVGRKGTPYPATVVVFDPKRDLAVLSVPGLRAPTLQQGPALTVGQDAVVAGYPGGGPYFSLEAKVLTVGPITINDGRTEGRDSYQVRGYAEHGSSGGPLLNTAGQVVGIVYAGDTDTARVEALTLAEAQPVLDAAASATNPVSTGTR